MKPAAVILAVFAASVAAVPVGDKLEKRQAVNLFSILENLLHIKTCTGQKFGDCPTKPSFIGKRKSVRSEGIVSVDTDVLMGARGL
ncbi:unnamed protein product [Clonostachys rosea f. rosea IK726]|uniref:Uncharacterized protein n=2 Tax=Bionectria ochroleuca TaxID=29856 RepID=A0A0B7KCY9_BIOOC|nr:unnamed protein product [Clonostachys rosea f. rosea IK726]